MSKLLPCPFCGGEARIENNDRTIYDPKTLGVVDVEYGEPPCFWVKCEDCEAFVGGFDTEVDAIAAWNRRADNAQLAEAQASVTQLGIALVQEREKSAEAQAADLSTLVNDLQIIQGRVAALEQENARLSSFADTLTERLEAKDYFIQLMAPHMAPIEAKKDVVTADFAELLRAYEKARGEDD